MDITRNQSLDALRGYAILTMILSGTVAYGDALPGWMYHAQVPPPLHKFNPLVNGITWVDLVFPFFIFSMGASIPLSLKKHIDTKNSFITVAVIALKRFFLLAFFALFTEHMKAGAIADAPGNSEHLLSMLAFLLLFFQFYNNKNDKLKFVFLTSKVVAFGVAAYLLWKLPFWSRKGFDFYRSDIIIMVLANMALFGTLLYYLTINKPYLRIGVLIFIMAIFLASNEPGEGWAKTIFNFNHIGSFRFDWLYQFYFLKYLFIIVPGTIAGEWMMTAEKTDNTQDIQLSQKTEYPLAFLAFTIICLNLYGLYTRILLLNLVGTVLLCAVALYITRRSDINYLLRRLVFAGSFLLLLGLFFEAYEGGIRKDPSTYSYYFVTCGLAYFALILFTVMANNKYSFPIAKYFSIVGKNPMIAYVTGSLLLLPLLSMTKLKVFWDGMNQNALLGFSKGVVFTAIVSLFTIFCVKKKWFWKT